MKTLMSTNDNSTALSKRITNSFVGGRSQHKDGGLRLASVTR